MEETERSEESVPSEVPTELALRGVLPGASRAWTLRGMAMVGRGDDCDVVLDYARVSRRHAEIYRQGPVVALKDLGSTNGTFVNGRRVQHAALREGSILRIGDWLGVVERADASDASQFREIAPGVFGGPALAKAFAPLARAAITDLPIVLIGSTGTGKERFAEAVHKLSGRTGVFHAINCAGLPSATAEAELFGYERGAFTGADRAYTGQLRAAHKGTLFLDEVAELPMPLQAKLLRALEIREVTPLGSVKPVAFDTRILAATQRPLAELVAAGSFREDLAARLDGLSVTIPSLRDRRGDAPSLFAHFIERHSGGHPPNITTKLYESLCLHDWPANVRELELLARRLLATHGLEPALRRRHLPDKFQTGDAENGESMPQPNVDESRSAHDHRRLVEALEKNGGNVKLAAEVIGISRQRAYRLMKEHGEPNGKKNGASGLSSHKGDRGDD